MGDTVECNMLNGVEQNREPFYSVQHVERKLHDYNSSFHGKCEEFNLGI